MIIKEKKQTINELHIDKEFSIQDHYCCRESKIHRKQTDVDASAGSKTTKLIPALVLPRNLANIMIAREACSDLVTRCDWI